MCLTSMEGLGAMEGSASDLELEVAKKRSRRLLGESKYLEARLDDQWVVARIGFVLIYISQFTKSHSTGSRERFVGELKLEKLAAGMLDDEVEIREIYLWPTRLPASTPLLYLPSTCSPTHCTNEQRSSMVSGDAKID